jgi:hypothetical protein
MVLAEELRRAEVIPFRAAGNANMDETFSLTGPYRLIYVRCHFAGGTGTAALDITVDSAAGPEYDVELTSGKSSGINFDLNFRVPGADVPMPSSWVIHAGDALRFTWTNPDPGNMTWGLEVGLARA